MYTKADQILDPKSDWNNAHNDEPVFVIRASNWRFAMILAACCRGDAAKETGLIDTVLAMREWHESNDEIPF